MTNIDFMQALYGDSSDVKPWLSYQSGASSGIPNYNYNGRAPAFGFAQRGGNSPAMVATGRAYAIAESPVAYTSDTDSFESDMEGTMLPGLSDANFSWNSVDSNIARAKSGSSLKDKNLARQGITEAWKVWMSAPEGTDKQNYARTIQNAAQFVNDDSGANAPMTPSEAFGISSGPSTGEKLFGGILGILPGAANAASQIIPAAMNRNTKAPQQLRLSSPASTGMSTGAMLGMAALGVGAIFLIMQATRKS